ncbi:MAG: class F sortase [Pseudonocardiaceae bacterium]|nr:class F sortase [Pseudonocardiaceae bacterium]
MVLTALLISGPATSPNPEADPARAAPTAPTTPTERALNTPAKPTTAKTVAGQALPESRPVSLEVPSINVHTGEIIELGLQPDRALEVPEDAETAGWYEKSPTPGERGPAIIAGHVDYNHVPGVFYRLHQLVVGAQATVHRADGTEAVFTVYRVDRYPKSGFPTEKVYGNTDEPELRLITCGGEFNRASGQYRDNIVAYAKLTGAFHRQ